MLALALAIGAGVLGGISGAGTVTGNGGRPEVAGPTSERAAQKRRACCRRRRTPTRPLPPRRQSQ
eukprot:9268138-Prorocentrum_lima.AAC.1